MVNIYSIKCAMEVSAVTVTLIAYLSCWGPDHEWKWQITYKQYSATRNKPYTEHLQKDVSETDVHVNMSFRTSLSY